MSLHRLFTTGRNLGGLTTRAAIMMCVAVGCMTLVTGCPPGLPCTSDADCVDDLWCNGTETCVIAEGETEGVCLEGVDPCPNVDCDEDADRCIVPCETADDCPLISCTDQACVDGVCTYEEIVCDDGDLCTTDACDPETGECVYTGIVCDEGEECDPETGECVVIDLCEGVTCGEGEECDPQTGACVLTRDADTDEDGVVDVDDNCPEDANADQADGDEDGVGDVCDNCPDDANPLQGDNDADGVGNICDNCINTVNPDQADENGDGIGDACEGEADNDGDGVHDTTDNCPFDANPDQEDSDSDGWGDVCDNCPDDANSAQSDGDNDNVGDICDNCPDDANADQADDDDDTVGNACDNCPNKANVNQVDTDGDTVGDLCDNCVNNANADQADSDGDGIGNVCDDDGGGGGNGGGSDIPIVVDAELDQTVAPCEDVTLSATAGAAGDPTITIAWSGDTGLVDNFVDNGNGTATFTVPADLSEASFTFTATGSTTQSGYTSGTDPITVLRAGVGPKTSGDVKPGDENVTLTLDSLTEGQDVPAGWSADWSQTSGDAVTLTPLNDLYVSFTAPSVTETTDLVFEVTINGTDCATAPTFTSVTVQVQVVDDLVFDLPDTIAVGEVLNLEDYWSTSASVTVNEFTVQYFVEDPPPDSLEYNLDQDAGTLEFTAGAADTVITVSMKVFGTAGELAEAADTIVLTAP